MTQDNEHPWAVFKDKEGPGHLVTAYGGRLVVATCLKLEHAVAIADRANRLQAAPDQIAAARDRYQSDEIQIDDDAAVSMADDNFWVQAWVWAGE